MDHDNSNLYKIILVFIIIFGIFSYGEGKGVYATKTNISQEKPRLPSSSSGATVPKPREDTKKNCDADCKIKELIDLGIRPEISKALVINCKALADDPVHCIKFGASIVKNESGGGYKCRAYNKFNCSGMMVTDNYKSYNDGILHWIGKYNKKWYTAKSMSFFYSESGSLPPTRYCTSEHSTKTKIGCPAGLKNSTQFFNKITF